MNVLFKAVLALAVFPARVRAEAHGECAAMEAAPDSSTLIQNMGEVLQCTAAQQPQPKDPTPPPPTPPPPATPPPTPSPATPSPATLPPPVTLPPATAPPVTSPPVTSPPVTPSPPTPPPSTTCAQRYCTTVTMTTTNTTTTTSTTTGTSTNTTKTTVTTATTTNTTTTTTVPTVTTTNSSTTTTTIVATTTTNSSTTTASTLTTTTTNSSTTTGTTTNTTTITSTTTATTTNTTTVTTVTTTNTSTTTSTTSKTTTSTNATSTSMISATTTNTSTTTKVTTRDPCVCMPTTTPMTRRLQGAPARRLVSAEACSKTCGMMKGAYADTNCNAIASGTSATCTSSMKFSLQYACMGTFTAKCPGNNSGNGTQPYVAAGRTVGESGASPVPPVNCQACAVGKIDGNSDLDPSATKFWVELKWGRNVLKRPTETEFQENMIDGYEVHIVDKSGAYVAMATTDIVPAKKWTTDCCADDAYSLPIQGNWPEGGYAFMIVPFQVVGGEMFAMPIGTMTAQFQDNKAGTARVVSGSVVLKEMTQADAVEFANHPDSKGVMRKSIVAADKDKKLTEANVIIKKLTAKDVPPATRRLGHTRRLAAHLTWTVLCDYEVLLPSGFASNIDEAWLNTTALTETVNAEATKAGMDIEVGASEVMVPTVDTITGDDALVTGAASSMAGTLLSVALAIFFTGRQFLF